MKETDVFTKEDILNRLEQLVVERDRQATEIARLSELVEEGKQIVLTAERNKDTTRRLVASKLQAMARRVCNEAHAGDIDEILDLVERKWLAAVLKYDAAASNLVSVTKERDALRERIQSIERAARQKRAAKRKRAKG